MEKATIFLCIVSLVLLLNGCGSPTLLQTAETREGFTITGKFSCSLVTEGH